MNLKHLLIEEPAPTNWQLDTNHMTWCFEWNVDIANVNTAKHGVSFEEAATVFCAPLAAIFDEATHSDEESRELIIGHPNKNLLLLVCFSEREDVIRIISARK